MRGVDISGIFNPAEMFGEKKAETIAEIKNVKSCMKQLKKDASIAIYLSDEMKANLTILSYQREQGHIRFGRKYYDIKRDSFIVECHISCEYVSYDVEAKISTFQEFNDFLKGELADAELQDYQFKEIFLKDYNISGAIISSKVLKAQGCYDERYYKKHKERIKNNFNNEVAQNELCEQSDFKYLKLVEDKGYDCYDNEHIPFFYVSDIHIDIMVDNHFKKMMTEEEVRFYIKELARKLIQSAGSVPYNSYLLLAGDICSEFEWLQMFFGELIKWWDQPEKIIVISGNHELWNPWINMEENIAFYREYYKKIGVTFLHNDLLIIKESRNHILSEKEILKYDENDLRNLARESPVMILGGIGFSGLNEKKNAINMRYGKSFEEKPPEKAILLDKKESNRFDVIYRKIKSVFSFNKVIVLTHMKKKDWNAEKHQPGWIYMNGHDHQSYFKISEQKTVYADNQIGYYSKSLGLKWFYLDNIYDIFEYSNDGISEITKEQYCEFNRGKRIDMKFNKEDGIIYMIKKQKIYMFFFYGLYCASAKEKHLYFLNGGELRKLYMDGINDLDYYENNMIKYSENVHLLLDKYEEYQQKISECIKKFGGSGKVHGCIIDVERPLNTEYSYCHLFVNPLDGQVTPYFAEDTQSRIIYRNFETMLESQDICKGLNDNYKKIEKELPQIWSTVHFSAELAEWKNRSLMVNEDSKIYKISKIIKKLQYLTDKNVIRIWSEELLNYNFQNYDYYTNKINDIFRC